MLQRLGALLSTIPEALRGPEGALMRPLQRGPPGGPKGPPPQGLIIGDPLSGPPRPLFGEEIRGLLPPGVVGPPGGAPTAAAVSLLPLVLLRASVWGEFTHGALLSGICYGLIGALNGPWEARRAPGGPPVQGAPNREETTDGQEKRRGAQGLPTGKVEMGAPKGGPQISCLIDLWPSAAVCQLAGALHLLGAPTPPFFRFVFSHYVPPGGPQGPPTKTPRRGPKDLRRAAAAANVSSSSSSSRSSAATATAAAAAARRSMRAVAAAEGALDPSEVEEGGPLEGGPLDAWGASVGWMLKTPQRQRGLLRFLLQQEGAPLGAPVKHVRDFSRCTRQQLLQLLLAAATSGAPPPPPQWIDNIMNLLGAPRRGAFTAAAAADTAECLRMLGLLLPYLPPLAAFPVVGGPPLEGWGPLNQEVQEALWGDPLGAPFSLFRGLREERIMKALPVSALPGLFLGLLLQLPPPKLLLQQQPHSSRNSSSSSSSSSNGFRVAPKRATLHWGGLGALAAAIEGTARGLLCLWEEQFAHTELRGAPLAAFFSLSNSDREGPEGPSYSGGPPQRHTGGPPREGLTAKAAARLCRQSLMASLALGHLMKALSVSFPAAAPTAAAAAGSAAAAADAAAVAEQHDHQQQLQQQKGIGRRQGQQQQRSRGLSLGVSLSLQLLPLRSLRHLLLLILLSSSPSLWGAPRGPKSQPIELLLLQLHQLQQQQQEQQQQQQQQQQQGCRFRLSGEEKSYAPPPAAATATAAAEAATAAQQQSQQQGLLQHEREAVIDALEAALGPPQQQQYQQQQQQFVAGGPSVSQFQREVAAAIEGLADILKHLPSGGPVGALGGPLGSRGGLRLEREVPVGPYFIDLVLAAPLEGPPRGP